MCAGVFSFCVVFHNRKKCNAELEWFQAAVTSHNKPEHLFPLFFLGLCSFGSRTQALDVRYMDSGLLVMRRARSCAQCTLLSSSSNKRLELMDIWPSTHSYTCVHQYQCVCQALFKGKVHPNDDTSAVIYSPSWMLIQENVPGNYVHPTGG